MAGLLLFLFGSAAVLALAWWGVLSPLFMVITVLAGLVVALVLLDVATSLVPPLRDYVDFWGLDVDGPVSRTAPTPPAPTTTTIGGDR